LYPEKVGDSCQEKMNRGDLSNEQWEKLKPLLPAQKPLTGKPNNEHRTVVNGILWILRTGAAWPDLPERYGKWQSVATRFYRWQKAAIWKQILEHLQAIADEQSFCSALRAKLMSFRLMLGNLLISPLLIYRIIFFTSINGLKL
jgi:transposase